MNSRLLPCLLLLATFASAQEPRREPPGPAEQARAGQRGPWQNDVVVYFAGSDGKVMRTHTFERAGVPTIARMGGSRLIVAHQHFPADRGADFDKVAVHFSDDDGRKWTDAQVIKVDGLPEGMRFPFDPTLVPLPDGRVRLYFTGNMGRHFGPSTPAIHSAISTDGVNYTYEPGVRFAVEGRAVIDCAVVLHAGVFHLYSPDNGAGPNPMQTQAPPGVGYHATSSDGLNFTRADDVRIEGNRRWLGNAQSDGKAITFYGTGPGVWTATSEDGAAWKLTQGPEIRGGDPGAVSTLDGGLLVVITDLPSRR